VKKAEAWILELLNMKTYIAGQPETRVDFDTTKADENGRKGTGM
jgi:hypothetical protein